MPLASRPAFCPLKCRNWEARILAIPASFLAACASAVAFGSEVKPAGTCCCGALWRRSWIRVLSQSRRQFTTRQSPELKGVGAPIWRTGRNRACLQRLSLRPASRLSVSAVQTEAAAMPCRSANIVQRKRLEWPSSISARTAPRLDIELASRNSAGTSARLHNPGTSARVRAPRRSIVRRIGTVPKSFRAREAASAFLQQPGPLASPSCAMEASNDLGGIDPDDGCS